MSMWKPMLEIFQFGLRLVGMSEKVSPVTIKLHTLTATQALALIDQNEITVEEYARALLKRIEDRNETVKAWTYLDPNLVLKQARDLDKIPRTERGPLHGMAVGIKDIMTTKGAQYYVNLRDKIVTPRAKICRLSTALLYTKTVSRTSTLPLSQFYVVRELLSWVGVYENTLFQSPTDDPKQGKTTTTEFTVLNSGPPTTNPHDVQRTPGGSSAGSAAAVADFQVPLSIGTQNGGSVIRPASYTGVFAIKPTLNAISPEGVKVVSFSIDTCGLFARSLEDLQLLADVFRFSKKGQPSVPSSIAETKVAFVKSPMWSLAGPGTKAAMEKAAKILQEHGACVEEVELPEKMRTESVWRQTHKVVLNYEGRAAFLKDVLLDVDKTKLDPRIRQFVENVSDITAPQISEAVDRFAAFRAAFDEFATKYTAIITPSAQDIAPLGLDDMGDSSFNFLWTELYAPVVHIPAFTGERGLPVGLSVVAGRFQDQYLLKVCKLLSDPLIAQGGWTITQEPPGSKF